MTTKATTPQAKKAAKEAAQRSVQPASTEQPTPKTRSSQNTVKTARDSKVYNKQVLDEIDSLGLPPHITSWDLSENPYDPESTILSFYVEDQAVTYVEVSLDNLEELMGALSEHLILLGDNDITGWSIRKPEDTSLPPILSLSSGGGIVATVALDKAVLKQMVPSLLKLYDPNKGKGGGFLRWATKHYIVSGTIGLLLTFGLVATVINFLSI
jgi:hypothetical protein